jgi:dihydrolipoamide dehydrogenase
VRPIPGFETDGERVVNSDHVLELKQVPKSMLVMGAGAVGVEFASVYSRFGCDTTIIELMPRLCPAKTKRFQRNYRRRFANGR